MKVSSKEALTKSMHADYCQIFRLLAAQNRRHTLCVSDFGTNTGKKW